MSKLLQLLNNLRRLVIYARYSSDMQSPKSCADQEREVRAALTRMGINHDNAVVIHDDAESGTKTYRDQFERLEQMIARGEVGLLVVDDQARLTRANNAFSFIQDLVYVGGRFLSTGEGIDTTQPGWELRVKVMELHNSTTILELGRRVRRGQAGRVQAGLTAGDYPYGYESYLVNPQLSYNGRGPKPEKNIRICEEQAKWIKQIFLWFVTGLSISAIAKRLTALKVPRPRRSKGSMWTHQQVRIILGNAKYAGVWAWGKTTTIRNSKGRKKQVATDPSQRAEVARPDLRIIDEATWDQAAALLRRLNQVFGKRDGQQKRGPRVHHTLLREDLGCRKFWKKLLRTSGGCWRSGGSQHRGIASVAMRPRQLSLSNPREI